MSYPSMPTRLPARLTNAVGNVAFMLTIIVCVAQAKSTAFAGNPCLPADANCDTAINIDDAAALANLLLGTAAACDTCTGDLDENGTIDGIDLSLFVEALLNPPAPTGACCTGGTGCIITTQAACVGAWQGANTPCNSSTCVAGNLTAFRPQHRGGGYFPFEQTPVSNLDEEDADFGPGIRINGPNDLDPQGEDDLIQVSIQVSDAGGLVALRRTTGALRVWLTAQKMPGTEIAFNSDKTGALPFMPGMPQLTVWIEWANGPHGIGDLILEPLTGSLEIDRLRFHTFRSVVFALGGEDQVPSVPVDFNQGTFVVGVALYQLGYDAYLYDEDNVVANGTGAVYNEAVNAVANRFVEEVAFFGYSHGGGSTYDLAERLDIDRAGIGNFEITFTSYADSVGNNSDFDISQETRRPPSTGFHANHYQVGSFADFFLDGGPVVNSQPGTTGLNVETVPFGVGADHFLVDDYVEVRNFIEDNLLLNTQR